MEAATKKDIVMHVLFRTQVLYQTLLAAVNINKSLPYPHSANPIGLPTTQGHYKPKQSERKRCRQSDGTTKYCTFLSV